ncbi:hypothetical protein OSB04_004800 [Centaurea solstitialis]|uniref:LOB domain-containing protein n=1 Tax=Centaurea solstitialis TaxID=347529 RepID=A0AA38WP45_9ASTR|nr:hypothetical protein OSB04_004800 [Centaurea solstitialis]
MTNNLNQNKLLHHHNHHHLIPPSSAAAANNNNRTNRSSSAPTPTTARSNSTTQACAACRYQRRKCAPDCILAPYFPHDRQRQFQNAHKLFGVSSITKIIRDLDPQQKDEAMRTIIYQSDVRAQDPVGGCYRIIRELQRQIEFSCAELEIVLHQLAICRAHAAQQNQQSQSHGPHHHHHQDHHQILIDGGVDCDIHLVSNPDDPHLYEDPSTVLDPDCGGNNNPPHHGLDLDLGHIPPQPHDQHNHDHDHEQYILGQPNLNDHDEGCEDDHVVPLQEINSWAAMNNSPPSSAVCLDVKPPQPLHAAAVDECEDFKPLMISDIPAGERHEFKFEFDEINEPSEEALFNEGNHKALAKEENVSFFTKEETVSYQQTNEDHDLKDTDSHVNIFFQSIKDLGRWSTSFAFTTIFPIFTCGYLEENKKRVWEWNEPLKRYRKQSKRKKSLRSDKPVKSWV